MAGPGKIARLYGPWRERGPADSVRLMRGFPGRWWIAGGWAIEMFTGVSRAHGDLDIGIARRDLSRFCDHVGDGFDIWAADRGSLTPVSLRPDSAQTPTCSNLWLRANGSSPWEYDVMLVDVDTTTWTYKRDRRISRPIEDVLWTREGIEYLRPEIQLLYKAAGVRDKDSEDFDSTASLLDPTARTWLVEALRTAHPGHPWTDRLSAPSNP